jgi:hypothetical protein
MAEARTAKATSVRPDANRLPRPARRQVTVADYSGLTPPAAIEAARASGLRPAPERVEVADGDSHGLVVAHDPEAGSVTTRGTILTLYVGAPATEPASALDDGGSDSDSQATWADAPLASSVRAAAGSEAELGLQERDPDEVATIDRLIVESPLAATGRREDAEDAHNPSVARSVGTSRPWRAKRALAVAAVLATIVLLSALTAHDSRPRRPSAVPAQRPHAHAPMSRRHKHRRRAKPNRARPVPLRRPRVVPAVIPRPPLVPQPFAPPLGSEAPAVPPARRSSGRLATDDEFF